MKTNPIILFGSVSATNKNKRSVLVILLFFLILSNNSYSQIPKIENYSVGYLNETIFRSGIIVGTEWTQKEWNASKLGNSDRNITKERAYIINPQFGLYNHVDNHTGLITKVDFTAMRKISESQFSHNWSLGLGLITQFNTGTTYVLKENKEISEEKNARRTYFNPSISYTLERQLDAMKSVFAKLGLGVKTPYNAWIAPTSLIVIGTKIKLN
ncbi:MAG: hypothetical protein ISP71_07680 [Flavobacteriales bacterium]|nr:hypothetical protein [Flavobacteriales bacterium]